MKFIRKLARILVDVRGQDIIEYGLLASFISVVAIIAVKAVGLLIVPLYEAVQTAIGG